jgi:hypothetical protein
MKKIYFCIIYFIVLASVSCKNDLFPFEAGEPLILNPTLNFDAKSLNNLCEIQYFEESILIDLINKKPIQDNYIYKAFEEWNNAKINVKFAFQRDLTKCNLNISKYLELDVAAVDAKTQDDLGLVRINGSLTSPKNPSDFFFTGLGAISSGYTYMVLPANTANYPNDGNTRRMVIMYFIGKYLGLPDSKDKNSCMYPYLVKDGTVGTITDEDIRILNTLHPYSTCGSVDIEVKSTAVNNDGTANLSVSYTNSNAKEKVYGCGVVLSEDSTILTIDRGSFYYFQQNNQSNNIYSGKISKLNAQTKYYVKAFSLDANGITYGKKITTLNIPNRQHDKWVTIPFDKNISFTTEYGSYFEYEGKLYLGLLEKGNSEGYLYQYEPLTGKINLITISSFPNLSVYNYNKLFYANGYIYVLNIYDTVNPTESRFKRLSLKTLTWETLLSPPGNIKYGITSSIFSNELYFYLVTYDQNNSSKFFQKYDIQKNSWSTINSYKSSETSPYDRLFYSYNHYLNNPYYLNNQFYFFNANFQKSYDYINDKWIDFSIQSYTNSNLVSNQNLYENFKYTETYSLPFQNQILKYYANHNNAYGVFIPNSGSGSYNETIYSANPRPYNALQSGLNNFDRQLLVTIDINTKIVKELCNPPENVKLRHLDSYYGNTFIIAANDNIYMGLIDSKTNTCKGITKYIP